MSEIIVATLIALSFAVATPQGATSSPEKGTTVSTTTTLETSGPGGNGSIVIIK